MDKKKIRVLVVDDEKIIRDFFSRLLSLQGLEVVGAEDGYKAIELARGSVFDLFFIDVRMPGLNGLETYRLIRKIIPTAMVVMMTGYAEDAILGQAEKEGARSSIRKPFEISEIKVIVDEISREGALNILVIDDDPVILDFFTNLLKGKNKSCKIARNRDEALALIRQNKFDLVFLDLVLKEISGLAIYKEIKEILPEVTIVAITGYPQKAKEMIAGNAEIAGCLYKPFEIESVLEYIKKAKAK